MVHSFEHIIERLNLFNLLKWTLRLIAHIPHSPRSQRAPEYPVFVQSHV